MQVIRVGVFQILKSGGGWGGKTLSASLVTTVRPALCTGAHLDRFSSYLRQPGPARGSLHPGRSLFREMSLSYSGEMDLGRSLLG